MHLPLLHISSRTSTEWDRDPLHIGLLKGRELIPWLADPDAALARVKYRTPFLDTIGLGLAAIGSELVYFALLSGLFSGYSRKTALSLAGVILPSVAVNQFVKARFRFTRPPRQAMHPYAFVAPGDYTFPSGHAQNAVVLGLFLAQRGKRKWVRNLGLAVAVGIPLSRVYLGVHYPRDVLGGALIGLGTLAVVNLAEPHFMRWWKQQPRGSRGFTVAMSTGIAGLLSGAPLTAFPLGMAGGLALGHDLSGQSRFTLDEQVRSGKSIALTALGMATVIGTGVAIRPLVKRESTIAASLAGGLVGLAMTAGVPIFADLAKRLRLWHSRKKQKNSGGVSMAESKPAEKSVRS